LHTLQVDIYEFEKTELNSQEEMEKQARLYAESELQKAKMDNQALQKAKMDKEVEMQATKHKWQELLEEGQRAHQQEKDLNSALQQQLDQVRGLLKRLACRALKLGPRQDLRHGDRLELLPVPDFPAFAEMSSCAKLFLCRCITHGAWHGLCCSPISHLDASYRLPHICVAAAAVVLCRCKMSATRRWTASTCWTWSSLLCAATQQACRWLCRRSSSMAQSWRRQWLPRTRCMAALCKPGMLLAGGDCWLQRWHDPAPFTLTDNQTSTCACLAQNAHTTTSSVCMV
jgi:hypothetical protein